MRTFRLLTVGASAALLTGCITTASDVVSLQPKAKQEYVTRGGERLLASRQAGSVVLIRPVATELSGEARPVFFVGVENLSKRPVEFRIANVSANVTSPQRQTLKVHSYDELVSEAHDRNTDEILSAVLLGEAANQASKSTTESLDTIGKLGSEQASAKSREVKSAVTAGNSAMVGGALIGGLERLDALEQTVLKDGHVMPGQWHGGQVHLDRPTGDGKKVYTIAVLVGGDRHEFDIAQQTRSD